MNVLVVGGGLSGICLGHQLEAANIPFKIIDNNNNHSTKVAAGMLNPMSFRRMIKSWRVDELLPFAQAFYTSLEKKLCATFFHDVSLRRVFSTEFEQKLWIERSNDNEYIPYISPIAQDTPSYVTHQFGSGIVQSFCFIDAATFLEENQLYFKKNDRFIEESFDFDALDCSSKTYEGTKFSHLIFAEGSKGEDNPFFSYLPFKNAKGELLTVYSPQLKEEEILNRKCFFLPVGKQRFKLGSTYAWNTTDVSTTPEAKEELMGKAALLVNSSVEIENHQAGIRPVAADRRPFIGEHPVHKGLYIFNGMGAKGFMVAPFFSKQFINTLLGKEKLDQEVDIQRFYAKFFQK